METEALASAAGHSFSLYSLFLAADIVVKGVMALLVIMSIWSWAVIVDKFFSIGGAVSRAKAFENAFWSGRSMDELDERVSDRPKDSMARVFASASREWRDSRRANLTEHQSKALIERAERLMRAATDREISRTENGLASLATIGSASPFIGLFGTVWGIMNAFRDIAAARESNLAVVAPGIAEALFATALGLIAAIPAVIFYNKFAGDVGRFSDRLETFVQEVIVRLSRRMDERGE